MATKTGVTVLSHSFTGSFITGVTAIDTDIGDNGLVLYSLQQTAFFQIDSVTGVITATQSMTAGLTYHMVVQAEDKVSFTAKPWTSIVSSIP